MLIQMTSTNLPVELVFIQLIFNICTSTPKHKRLWCVKLAMFNFKNILESCKIHERWKESTKIQKPDILKSLQDEQSLSWSVPPLYPKDFIEQFSESCYYNTKSIWIMKLWMKTLWMWTPFILSSWKAKQKKKKSKGRQRCVIGRGGSPWYCEGQRGSRPCADDSFRDFDEYVSDRAETESRDLGTGGRSQLLIKGSEGPLCKCKKVKGQGQRQSYLYRTFPDRRCSKCITI